MTTAHLRPVKNLLFMFKSNWHAQIEFCNVKNVCVAVSQIMECPFRGDNRGVDVYILRLYTCNFGYTHMHSFSRDS